jgi:chromosome segregation ATPase
LEIQKLERQIAEELETHASISKDAQIAIKEGKKTRNRIHEKQIAISNYENELSIMDLEIFNCETRIAGLKEESAKLTKEIAARNELIERYEVEIRQNNDQLSKKAGEMDVLNKKYDQLTSGNQVIDA